MSKFIVVEGIDGAGSTTLSKMLVEALDASGVESVWTKEPSNGVVGRHIRRILKGDETASEDGMFPLFIADRFDHTASIVLPELESGNVVVCDRYAYSTWVYQQDTWPVETIEALHKRCKVPDVVFVLHAPVEVCMERIGKRDVIERYEIEEKQRLYAERYIGLQQMGEELIVHLDSHKNPPDVLLEQALDVLYDGGISYRARR